MIIIFMVDYIDNLYIEINNYKKEELTNKYLQLLQKYNIDIINFLFFTTHNFIMDYEKYKQKIDRIQQEKFRNELIELYGNKCLLTGVSIFEACHIIPFSDCDFSNKYDKNNGVLLKNDLHHLFDNYLFSINPDTQCIEFDESFFINVNNKNEYERFNGLKINVILNEQTKNNLLVHYLNFIN